MSPVRAFGQEPDHELSVARRATSRAETVGFISGQLRCYTAHVYGRFPKQRLQSSGRASGRPSCVICHVVTTKLPCSQHGVDPAGIGGVTDLGALPPACQVRSVVSLS